MVRYIKDDSEFMNATLNPVQVVEVKAELTRLQQEIDTQMTWKDVMSVVMTIAGIAKRVT